MNKKGLTLTIVFEGSSLNYGEGMGNVSSLKKEVKSDGKVYSYVSRQAIRYNITEQLKYDNTPVTNKKGVVQYDDKATIEQYPEIDLFGYMKTEKEKSGKTRSAVVRITNADSLTPFSSDMDFLTNMGLAKRIGADNSIASSEIHNSKYSYTIAIDLDKVGIDGEINIKAEEKIKRVSNLLDTIHILYRDIKGRTENLNPIFIIGGVYDCKNPYFMNSIKLKNGKLNCELIKDTINNYTETAENTLIAAIPDRFENPDDIREICNCSVREFFDKLKMEIKEYYESN